MLTVKLRQAAALVLAGSLAASAPAQSVADLTGLTALIQRVGDGLQPTGAGVSSGQVEAPAPGWAPDTTHPEFAGKTFSYHSPTPSISGHATTVGQYYYGAATGIAPGISDVHCWNANGWLGLGFLNGTGSTPPLLSPCKVFNNSWIGSGSNGYLRKLDYAIQTQGLLVCSGVNNGNGPLDVTLLSHAFNGIACGRSDGQHHAGGTLTGIDKPGRMKPEIVAPAGATSFSTPLVAGAGALLIDTARNWPSTAWNPDAERPDVIKAVLLAGANHRSGWSNAPDPSGPTRGATQTPLDLLWGCDQVDVNRSHWILTAGEQPSGSDLGSAALVAPQGWELVATTSGASRFWRFQVERTKQHVSILATWNRQVASNFGGFDCPDLDLELFAVDAFGALVPLVGSAPNAYFGAGNVASASPRDNLEHLFTSDLQPGEYVLELRRASDLLGPWKVAVAWEFACDEALAYGSGKSTSQGGEARLAARGIPSAAGGAFRLSVSNAIPNAHGVVFWGAGAASLPFQGGTRWVAAPIHRMGVVTCDASGALEFGVVIDPSMPGTTRYYQFWFRDPQQPDGTYVGLTNGVAVPFCR